MNKKTGITIILPSAGKGSRLGLHSPKELLPITHDIRLIDFSLSHIAIAANSLPSNICLQLAVVIRPGKEAIVPYIRNRLPGLKVNTCYFNDNYHEWPGSVWSAHEFYSSFNMVLLPDSVMFVSRSNWLTSDSGESLIQIMLHCLVQSAVCFGVVPCRNPLKLSSLGAVFREKDGRITHFKDKPKKNLYKFNGYWSSYGFRRDMGKTVYKFLVQSVRRRSVKISHYFSSQPGSCHLFDHIDLGTWPAISSFLASSQSKTILSSTRAVLHQEVPEQSFPNI